MSEKVRRIDRLPMLAWTLQDWVQFALEWAIDLTKLPNITVDAVLDAHNHHIAPVGDVEVRIEVRTETRQFHHTAMLRYMGEGEYRLICPSCGKPSEWLQVVTDTALWCGDPVCFLNIVKGVSDTHSGE